MTETVQSIAEKTRALVRRKMEMEKLSAGYDDIIGDSVTNMPGSESDGTIDPAPIAAKAQAETKDRISPEPANARNADGAGDNSPLTRSGLLDITDKAEEDPKKVPAEDTNFDADRPDETSKSASLCNDILADIKSYQETKEAATKEDATKEADTKEDAKKEVTKEADSVDTIELNQDVLAKIAGVILSTKEGWDYTENVLKKTAGAEKAKEIVSGVVALDKQASYESGINDAQLLIQSVLNNSLTKTSQDIGGEEAPAAVGGEEGGDITPEDLGQALAEMVQSGEIDAEEAQAVAEEIDAASEDGGEEAPPEDMGGEEEAVAPEVLGDEEAEKAASYNVGIQDALTLMKAAQDIGGEEAAIDQELPEEDVTPEDLGQALAEAVQAGEIGAEDAQAIAQQLDDEMGAGDAVAEDMGGEEMGGEEMAPEEIAQEAEKQAAYYAGIAAAYRI